MQWHSKTAKKLPKAIKEQLGDLAKLSKNQKILAIPAEGSAPAIVALWWPWDHGGTYSLRIKILENSYETTPEESGVFSWLKSVFISS